MRDAYTSVRAQMAEILKITPDAIAAQAHSKWTEERKRIRELYAPMVPDARYVAGRYGVPTIDSIMAILVKNKKPYSMTSVVEVAIRILRDYHTGPDRESVWDDDTYRDEFKLEYLEAMYTRGVTRRGSFTPVLCSNCRKNISSIGNWCASCDS